MVGLHWVMTVMQLPAYRSAGLRTVAASEIDPKRIEQTQKDALLILGVKPDKKIWDLKHWHNIKQ